MVAAEALDQHRELSAEIALVTLLAQVALEVLFRVIDQVDMADHGVDSVVLDWSLRGARVRPLDVG
jgi:hypothetical protein